MSLKKCRMCGKMFEGRTNSSVCPGPHYRACQLCGKEFQLKGQGLNDSRKYCSDKCKITARRIKFNQQGKYIHTCIICNQEFHTDNKNCFICSLHTHAKCSECGKEFELVSKDRKVLDCGDPECHRAALEKHFMETLGVKNPSLLPEVQEHKKQTMIERYGAPYSMQSEQLKQKFKENNQKKYGVDWALERKDVQEKSKKTNIEKYGAENVFCSGTITREKEKQTWIDKYGVDNPFKSEEVKDRIKETNLEKYGYEYAHSAPEVREQTSKTRIQSFANSLEEPYRTEYLKFKENPSKYIEDLHITDPMIGPKEVADKIGHSDPTTLYEFYAENGIEWEHNRSHMESQLVNFLKSVDPEINIVLHERKILNNKEIDIYLPEYSLGIECNPTITHNSTISYGDATNRFESSDPPPSKNYHRDKSIMCQKAGIFLFHIFGYEWTAKRKIIESMIINLLGKNSTKYGARQLVVREVPKTISSQFLNENHRQGDAVSKIRLGLYTDSDELVSLMTFGKTRKGLGKHKDDDSDSWELLRFCNKRNTNVSGGASKLFKYFVSHYNYSKIVSFSDIAHTKGQLYEKLNFVKVSEADPNYVWVNFKTDLYFTRVTCQKHNLPKLFNEPDLDIKNQTEQQIMVAHGFVQVFDSGVIRWEYTN